MSLKLAAFGSDPFYFLENHVAYISRSSSLDRSISRTNLAKCRRLRISIFASESRFLKHALLTMEEPYESIENGY